ncbi:MAG TPA: hypothetical protein PLK31_26995, partial [Chloroflexota bacterium]|nr:hypothetical protein [Chloroflexota bacterium]
GAALVVGPSTRDGLFRVVWLHDGRERLLFTTPAWPSVNSVTQLEPGRFLLSYNMEFADENGDNPGYRYNMIEMMADACDDETCAVQPFEKWVQ